MSERLTADDLVALVRRVFSPGPTDRRMAVIVDMPDEQVPDEPTWRERREMAAEWVRLLAPRAGDAGLADVRLFLYRNPHANNANLPATGYFFDPSAGPLPATAGELPGAAVPFDRIFEAFQLLMAPTQFSATAPLKMAAKEFGFRAATMPGFTADMIPALRIDYAVVGRRVDRLKEILDDATRCDITFDAAGGSHRLVLDLRHRKGIASGGVFPHPGTAGNVPSGETYIVPYEGEREGDPTLSAGEIPVQFGGDIVVYRVEGNVAVEVISDNAASREEARRLAEEPAYGNMAELGLGVLGDFGLAPTGQLLLDEKLGLHIALHIDRVYTPEIQPLVKIVTAVLTMSDGSPLELMRDGAYSVELG